MIRKSIAALLLVCSTSGCFGHYGLRNKVLNFNLTAVENRWGREFLFLGMTVIPIYPICALLDLVIFNSVEFWTGSNPINGKSPIVDVPKSEIEKLGLGGIDVAQVERIDETLAQLHLRFENGDRVTFDVVRDGDSYTVSYAGVEFYKGELGM